jgi:Fe-S-cluster-containing dehydrogenase component/CRP-like cAMP-binding protein
VKAWPGVVWTAPALRDLDARAQAEIAAAGAIRRIPARDWAYRAGDPAESFFVVVEGAIHVHAQTDDRRAPREAGKGETFGEEAFVGEGVLRRGDAVAANGATVAAIPASLMRRALARLASRSAERIERTIRRAAARERLRSSVLARALGDSSDPLNLLLDALEHVHFGRGEVLFRPGESSDRAFLVASGLVRLDGADGAIPAHVAVGEVFGAEEVLAGGPRTHLATASGPVWCLSLPGNALREVAKRAPAVFAAAREAMADRVAARMRAVGEVDPVRSVVADLHRFDVARSLVLIDQACCVECGHCSSSCGDAHADGISRLVRRGEVVRARMDEGESARALLVAKSCQHCVSAACLPVCPTGAIRHGAGGEVVLREALCTGCGACAKACPWDAIRMAPRDGGGGMVAVKCDLCPENERGPACVDACPTGALHRVAPRLEVADARIALGNQLPARAAVERSIPAWPFVSLGIVLAGTVWNGPTAKLASGAIAGIAFVLLGAHAAWKRVVRGSGRAGYVAHLALAPLAFAAAVHHTEWRIRGDVAGALTIAAAGALASGLWGAIAYLALPPVLARVAEVGALPEDYDARFKELEARGFSELTGKSERVKSIFRDRLGPYMRAGGTTLAFLVRLGVATLAARRGDLDSERTRLRERIVGALGGDPAAQNEVEPLVRTAVQIRALHAERWLHALLRGWLPVHVIAASVAVALLLAHVVMVAVFR